MRYAGAGYHARMGRDEQATSFGAAADVFDRARPSYPADAVDWILQSAPVDVVDLGAGTGIFTRLLAGRGNVIAVDPDPAMLAKITVPDVETLVGTAEHLPLEDDSADLIVAAQAWHWVDEALAIPEAARVLRPGGWLAMTWNTRDLREPWIRALRDVVEDSPAEKVADLLPELGTLFGPVETFETRWWRDTTREGLVDLVRSRSLFITSTPDEQRRTLAELDAVPRRASVDRGARDVRGAVPHLLLSRAGAVVPVAAHSCAVSANYAGCPWLSPSASSDSRTWASRPCSTP